MPNKNPYIWAGLGLLVAGSIIFLVAYFILLLTWLSALGISMLILAVILLALGRTIPKVSPEVGSLLLEAGVSNIDTLVEELGIKTRALYLPASLAGGKPRALMPLRLNPSLPSITEALPRRLIVRYGDGPDEVGLLVTTVGAIAVSLVENKLDLAPDKIESVLTSLLMGSLDMADRAKVTASDSNISVEIYNPRIENEKTWANQCLGSPLASIVASITAEAWDKPVTIEREAYQKGKCFIGLEVVA